VKEDGWRKKKRKGGERKRRRTKKKRGEERKKREVKKGKREVKEGRRARAQRIRVGHRLAFAPKNAFCEIRNYLLLLQRRQQRQQQRQQQQQQQQQLQQQRINHEKTEEGKGRYNQEKKRNAWNFGGNEKPSNVASKTEFFNSASSIFSFYN